MDGGNGVKTIVYNTKKDSKRGTQEKRLEKRKRERKSKRLKKYNSKKEEFSILSHSNRACPKILFACVRVYLFPFNTIYKYLYPRFRLVFSPTLYKFIIRTFWAWVHSCSGFKSKLVLTYIYIYIYWLNIYINHNISVCEYKK